MVKNHKILQIIKSKYFNHGLLYTMFSFINNGISFILLLILAKFLTPYDYGQLNLFTTFVTLSNIVITLCSTAYISVSFFQKDKETLKQVILSALGITTVMLLVFSSLMIICPEIIEKYIGIDIKYLWIGLLISYFQVFNSVNLDIWRLEEKPIYYGLYSVSLAICNFILSVGLIVLCKLGWIGRVYAWWILSSIYFFMSIIFLIKRQYLSFLKPSKSIIYEILIYALPILPHSISFWLKLSLDRYIINYFHSQSIVGYFSFAMNLAAIIGIVGNAFNANNSVFLYKKLAEGYDKVKEILTKQSKIMTITFLIVSIGVYLFAFVLIKWGLPKYESSMPYLIPFCIGGYAQCIYLLWVNYLFFYKKTTQLMTVTLSTGILQVILSLWLTRFSAIYTVYISMGINIITALLVILLAKRTLHENTESYNS